MCGRFVVLMWPVEKVGLVRVMYGGFLQMMRSKKKKKMGYCDN